jgi:UDP-glucose 6-dehydrogenase
MLQNKKIAIIGLGYVGLPLAIEFGKKYRVLGFDINKDRIDELTSGRDRTNEADLEGLMFAMNLSSNGKLGLGFSYNVDDLKSYNVYIVTVPTPIDQFKAPDLTPLLKASEMIGKILKKGDLISFHSYKNNSNFHLNSILNKIYSNPRFCSFVEVDFYTKTIIIVKDLEELTQDDFNFLVNEYFDLKKFRDYI